MRTLIAAIVLVLAAAAAATPARADTFPSRTITLIVPFPPGGSTDVAGRILAQRMGEALGQTVIVENLGGAGGSIAVGRLARAAPDGYTIDIGQWDTHVGTIIYSPSYDLQKDFAPIGLASLNPMLLVAKKTLPADDLKSLAAWMKAHPGDAKFVNQNASAQVGGILLQNLTGTKVLFVPYRGAGPAMTDLISGQVDLLLVQGAVALPQVRAGTIKALAELSPARSPSMPDIPSADDRRLVRFDGRSGLLPGGGKGGVTRSTRDLHATYVPIDFAAPFPYTPGSTARLFAAFVLPPPAARRSENQQVHNCKKPRGQAA